MKKIQKKAKKPSAVFFTVKKVPDKKESGFFGFKQIVHLALVVMLALWSLGLPVGTQASVIDPKPDLTATKTHTGNLVVGGSFTWIIHVANIGTSSATFDENEVILQDNMPVSHVGDYGKVSVAAAGGVTGVPGNLECEQKGNNDADLVCQVKNDDRKGPHDDHDNPKVVIPVGGYIDFSVTVHPTAVGSLNNPRSGSNGQCKVDPNSKIHESNDKNNLCSDSVTIKLAPGTLKVIKVVSNKYGGTATPDQFSFSVNSGAFQPFNTNGENDLSEDPGTYTVTETNPAPMGYEAGYNNCRGVHLSSGDTKTCTITNTYQAPPSPAPATLMVIKHVVNDGGGTKKASDFTINVSGTGVSKSSFSGEEDPGTTVTLAADEHYSVDENELPNYNKTVSGDCSGAIASGETKTCAITNTFTPPATVFHFIKNECPAYADIAGNEAAGNLDFSGNNFTQFSNYSGGSFTPAPIKPVDPSTEPDVSKQNCAGAPGWKFNLADNQNMSGATLVGPTNSLGRIDAAFGDLPASVQTALIGGGQMWVSEDLKDAPDSSGFGTLRCYQDALNGDNLDYVFLGGTIASWPANVYCIAYNVNASTPPPSGDTGTIVVNKTTDPASDTTTEFSFVTEGAGYNPFTLTGGQKNEQTLPAGSYSVAEGTLPAGWLQTEASCTDGKTSINPANISLSAGETVTCNFTNTFTPPPVCQTVIKTLVSGTGTLTAGYTGSNPQANPLDPSLYSIGSLTGGAAVADPVIPPWLDPAVNTDFAGSGAVWVSTTSTPPGNGGEGLPTEDQWRLFSTSFTLPAGSDLSPITLVYSADNAATVYFNGTEIASTTDLSTFAPFISNPPYVFSNSYTAVFTPVIGLNTVRFVLRNEGGDYSVNPTAIIYKLTYQGQDPESCGDGGNVSVADPALVKTISNGTPAPGATVTYTLVATNNGTATATAVSVTDPLPSDVVYVSNDAGAGYDATTTTVTWNIGDMGPSASSTLHIIATINGSVGSSVANTAAIASTGGDSNSSNNSSTAVAVLTSSGGGTVTSFGSSVGGGGGSSFVTALPQILGTSTGSSLQMPIEEGQVLGASTTLPRTGVPPTFLFLAFTAAVALANRKLKLI